MRRRVCALAATGAVALGLPAVDANAGIAYPTRFQASAREYYFVLSRQRISNGVVTVQLVNYGEDDHDLRMRRVGGVRTYRIPVTRPGAVTQARFRIYAGTFRVWCSLPGHRQAGMRGTIYAVRP